MLKGNSPDVVNSNIQMLKDSGYEHDKAVRCALCYSNKKHASDAKRVSKKVVKKSPPSVLIKK